MRTQTFAFLVLAALAAILVVSTMERWREGRCRMGGRRGGMDCSYPAGAFPPGRQARSARHLPTF
jgi:hypothetical protein